MQINGYENLNFVKWAGGKQHLINQIEQYLPKKIDRYFEPFIGGGALFFYIMQRYKPKFAFISDINQNLILTYEVIRDDVEILIQQLRIHKKNHRKDFEKFGNKKTIKINELNKKAKKIKIYLKEGSSLLAQQGSLRLAGAKAASSQGARSPLGRPWAKLAAHRAAPLGCFAALAARLRLAAAGARERKRGVRQACPWGSAWGCASALARRWGGEPPQGRLVARYVWRK